jgi:2-hydroxychromene-2-carboxylate isomerase
MGFLSSAWSRSDNLRAQLPLSGSMGVVISLDARRAASSPLGGGDVAFHFDLSCPFSYLAAERVERCLGEVAWVPVSLEPPALRPAGGERTPGSGAAPGSERWRAAAERRAEELRLPLSWPERLPVQIRCAHRLAVLAAELGAGSRFALAAARLAFCGGFDLAQEGVLLEAAAAAGISVRRARQAIADPARDGALVAAASRLRTAGVTLLPAVCVDGRWFAGERALAHAALRLRARAC